MAYTSDVKQRTQPFQKKKHRLHFSMQVTITTDVCQDNVMLVVLEVLVSRVLKIIICNHNLQNNTNSLLD